MWRWIILCCMFRAVSGQCCNCAPNSLSTTQCYAFWFIDCATTCTAQSQYQACINGNPNYQPHTAGHTCAQDYDVLSTCTCSVCGAGYYQVVVANTQTGCVACSICGAGQYVSSPCGGSQNTQCSPCPAGYTSPGNNAPCNTCVAGYYETPSSTSGIVCSSCSTATCVSTQYINCNSINTQTQCQTCTGSLAPFCGVGKQQSTPCNGVGTTNPTCVPCPAGYYNSVPNIACSECPTGTYAANSGQSQCTACTNGPWGSYYLSWGSFIPNANACPWGCTAGFYLFENSQNTWTCVLCNATAGGYQNQAYLYCFSCTNKPAANSYYLIGVLFLGTTNTCPWYVRGVFRAAARSFDGF